MSDLRQVPWLRISAESVAIIASILIAFAIDAWWDQQQEFERERVTIRSLEQELSHNRRKVRNRIEQLERWELLIIESIATAGRDIDDITEQDVVEKILWIQGPFQTEYFSKAALQDTLASGAYGLIRSSELRQAINGYEQVLTQDLDRQLSLTQFWANEMGPYHMEHADLLAMFQASGPAGMSWASRFNLPKPDTNIQLNLAAFVGNQKYTNLLTARLVQQDLLADSHRELIASMDLVLKLINNEVNEKHTGTH